MGPVMLTLSGFKSRNRCILSISKGAAINSEILLAVTLARLVLSVLKIGIFIKILDNCLKFLKNPWNSDIAAGVEDSQLLFVLNFDRKFEIPARGRGVLGVILSEIFP